MQKYKQVNVVHPEDVGVPRKLMSDLSPNSAEPSVMEKHKWPLLILAFVIVAAISAAVGAAIWSSPQRSPFEINMYGTRMTAEGKILTSGSVILQGERLDYRSESQVSELECTKFVLLDTEFNKSNVHFFFNEDWLIGSASKNSNQIIYSLWFEFGPDGDWCVIRQNDLYIVCSQTEDFDPMEIFANSIFAKSEG